MITRNAVKQKKLELLTDDEEKILNNLSQLNELILKKLDETVSKNVKSDQKFIEKTDQIISKVQKKTRSYRRLFDILAVLMLIVALVLLNWENVRIYLIYTLRLLIVLVFLLIKRMF
jgi:hypothetical protein